MATWFAVHILARMPVGGRFGLENSALPTAIRLETGVGLDDIEVSQSGGDAVHVQCKTSATLATGEKAPLSKTGGQLARWVADAKSGAGLPDPTRNAAVLAVRSDAARTLDDLESGCRAFDLGGSWSVTLGQRNQAERAALGALETIVTREWTRASGRRSRRRRLRGHGTDSPPRAVLDGRGGRRLARGVGSATSPATPGRGTGSRSRSETGSRSCSPGMAGPCSATDYTNGPPTRSRTATSSTPTPHRCGERSSADTLPPRRMGIARCATARRAASRRY